MKNIKKIFMAMVCSFLVFLLVEGSEKVTAAGKDITNAVTDKGKIEKLNYEFRDMLGYYVCQSLEIGESKLFDFSKKNSRQEAIKFAYWKHGELNGSDQDKLSRQLFGAGVTKIEPMMGEWGCSHPLLKISKIYKMSAKQYQIKLNIYMEDDDGGREKVGTAVVFMKKNAKAKYGYFVEKIIVSRKKKEILR